PGNSDTLTSTALLRPSAFQSTLASVWFNTIQVNGAAWSANQFVYSRGVQPNTYFLLVRGGLRAGDSFVITANGTSSLVLQTGGDLLSGLSPGDPISIIPFWTLGTIFPGGAGVHASST